jgi:hypothetical protein
MAASLISMWVDKYEIATLTCLYLIAVLLYDIRDKSE